MVVVFTVSQGVIALVVRRRPVVGDGQSRPEMDEKEERVTQKMKINIKNEQMGKLRDNERVCKSGGEYSFTASSCFPRIAYF